MVPTLGVGKLKYWLDTLGLLVAIFPIASTPDATMIPPTLKTPNPLQLPLPVNPLVKPSQGVTPKT